MGKLTIVQVKNAQNGGSISDLQPIADRVAQNLEIISKNFQFGTRRTRILMGFIIYLIGTNRKSHRRNSGSLQKS